MAKYIIDASSLNELQFKYPNHIPIFEPIYKKLDEMFEDEELFSIREVFEELRDSQEYWEDYEECFRELTENEFDKMSELLKEKEFSVFISHGINNNDGYWADPQLIACAMVDSDVVIVTQESLRKNPQRKIPYICKKKGIRCIKLIEFLDEINI